MIVLNLKTYPETLQKAALFSEVANEVVESSGLRIIICPPAPFLMACSERNEVFAQHVDADPSGAYTGSISAEMLKLVKAKGSLLNHSEKKLTAEKVKAGIESLHMNGLESLVCAATTNEASNLAHHTPTFIAVEPPELIGSGVSVSKTRPEIVINSVKAVKEVNHRITVLCGAGVSSKEDVKKALELGSEGVLLASAFVKAKDPKTFLQELASTF